MLRSIRTPIWYPVNWPPPTVTCRDHGTNCTVGRSRTKGASVGNLERIGRHTAGSTTSRRSSTRPWTQASTLGARISPFAVVEGLGLPSGSSVVDIGCGRGLQALELSRWFGFNVIGIDPVYRQHDADRGGWLPETRKGRVP